MKELSIEEKAKAYDEAYEKVAIRFGSNVADEIFPELKESEDERIRKGLLALVEWSKSYAASGITTDDAKDMIAWLEKQGKQEKLNAYIDKLASDTIYNDENGNPIDKDLMAFASKVAFSMIPATKTESYHHLNRGRISDAVIKGALWQKKQDSQILANSAKTCKDEQKPAEWSEDLVKEVLLSEVLPSFMHGGEADEVVAKLDEVMSTKVIAQPKTEWSEEDENTVASIISSLSNPQLYPPTIHDIEWLKSLKPQNTWKPSDEQMNAVKDAIDYLGCNTKKVREYLMSLYEQLKKLRKE